MNLYRHRRSTLRKVPLTFKHFEWLCGTPPRRSVPPSPPRCSALMDSGVYLVNPEEPRPNMGVTRHLYTATKRGWRSPDAWAPSTCRRRSAFLNSWALNNPAWITVKRALQASDVSSVRRQTGTWSVVAGGRLQFAEYQIKSSKNTWDVAEILILVGDPDEAASQW